MVSKVPEEDGKEGTGATFFAFESEMAVVGAVRLFEGFGLMVVAKGDWAGGRAEAGEKNVNDGRRRAGIMSVADADADSDTAALRKHGPPAAGRLVESDPSVASFSFEAAARMSLPATRKWARARAGAGAWCLFLPAEEEAEAEARVGSTGAGV